MSIQREQLAWAAGFFEGEGSVGAYYIKNGNRWVLKLSIAQVEREPLDKFHAAIGGLGRVYGPYKQRNEKSSPQFLFMMNSFEACQAVIAMIWRWLSAKRKKQAFTALRNYRDGSELAKQYRLICK